MSFATVSAARAPRRGDARYQAPLFAVQGTPPRAAPPRLGPVLKVHQLGGEDCGSAALTCAAREIWHLAPPAFGADPLHQRLRARASGLSGGRGSTMTELAQMASELGLTVCFGFNAHDPATIRFESDVLHGWAKEHGAPVLTVGAALKRLGPQGRVLLPIGNRLDPHAVSHAIMMRPDGSVMDPFLGENFPSLRALRAAYEDRGWDADLLGYVVIVQQP